MAQTGELENIAESVLLVAEDIMRSNTKFHMTYLYGGTTAQQIEQVEKAGAVQTVSPAYFDLNAQGSLVLNGVSSTLISEMHRKGIEVVPMLSNHWDRRRGKKRCKILKNWPIRSCRRLNSTIWTGSMSTSKT